MLRIVCYNIICVCLASFNIVAGDIFFTMPSINLTVPWFLNSSQNLPPLIEIVLLQDVPDFLVNPESYGNEEREKETYSLSEHPPDGWFYLENRSLRVKEDFFQPDAMKSADNYKLTVHGKMGSSGPAVMTVNVGLADPFEICQKPQQLCFWENAEYQIAENLESPDIGALSSAIFQSVCPQYSIKYTVGDPKCKKKFKCAGRNKIMVKRTENGRSPWVLAVRDMLDRELASEEIVNVTCEVLGPGSKMILRKKVIVRVRDIDDNAPKIMRFEITPSVAKKTSLTEGEVVATGYFTDQDLPETNHFLTTSTDDDLKIKCKPPELGNSTLINCSLIAKKALTLTDDKTFEIRATATSFIPGYGGVNYASTTLTLKGQDVPTALPMTSKLPYPGVPVRVKLRMKPSKYITYTRVMVPQGKEDGRYFQLDSPYFGVTEKDGIVYVKDGTRLKEGNMSLTIKWRTRDKIQNQTVVIEIMASPTNCNKTIRDGREWCAEAEDRSQCESLCGYGSENGKCHWISKTSNNKTYQSCSVAEFSSYCPDDDCDELEKLQPGICPQDCTEKVIGTAFTQANKTGYQRAWGICYWERQNVGHCALSNQSSNHPIQVEEDNVESPYEPSETDTSVCGLPCQASAAGFSLSLAVGVFILLLYIRRLRRQSKRCILEPVKEDIASTTYDASVRRPLRDPDTPCRPEFYDAKWEFPRHRLTIEETVGEGEFGKVIKARADGIQGCKGQKTVAVKTLKSGAKDSELNDLISELQLLKDVDHPNVIKLMGACTTEDGPIYVIIEYAENGSLRNYLKKHRVSVGDEKEEGCYLEGVNPLTARHILTFAWHIAKGMAYLADMKLVHRDLAARNVLLTSELVCKISDFGLTRDIYEDDTYMKRSRGKVPIKWMALESLANHIYTSKSDVWSYGILLWELVTRGNSPYPGVMAQNLHDFLQEGYRMEKPPGCSNELYGLMRACWAANPAHRPTFAAIVTHIEAMLSASRDYLDLRPSAVENRQYMDSQDVQWQFEGYDRPTVPPCCPGQCTHVKYENELQAFNVELISGEKRFETSPMKDFGGSLSNN